MSQWAKTRALADDILKYQGKSDSAFMKYPKNSYRSNANIDKIIILEMRR